MKSAIITFVVGFVLLAVVGVFTLDHAPSRLVRIGAPGKKATEPAGAVAVLSLVTKDPTVCQAGEVLPAGITAIRLSQWAFLGSHVRLAVYQGPRVIASGERGAEWTGTSVAVPVHPLSYGHSGVTVCETFGPNSEPIALIGNPTPASQGADLSEEAVRPGQLGAADAKQLPGRLTIEYVAPGSGSWWSRILAVARRLGLGRAYTGTWIALLVAALMAAVSVLAVRLALKEIS